MEKNNLNNKGANMFVMLSKELKNLDKIIDQVLEMGAEAEKQILSQMTAKERAKKRAFDKKCADLLAKGDLIEAEKLKKSLSK